jgi:hypothetical protein
LPSTFTNSFIHSFMSVYSMIPLLPSEMCGMVKLWEQSPMTSTETLCQCSWQWTHFPFTWSFIFLFWKKDL